jgi:hypothetical protein
MATMPANPTAKRCVIFILNPRLNLFSTTVEPGPVPRPAPVHYSEVLPDGNSFLTIFSKD